MNALRVPVIKKGGIDRLFNSKHICPKTHILDFIRKHGPDRGEDILAWIGGEHLWERFLTARDSVSCIIDPRPYQLEQGQVYTDFAAKHLGGGVVSSAYSGYVQEEKTTMCLDLLYVLAYKQLYRKNDRGPTRIYPELDVDLSRRPMLLNTTVLFDEDLSLGLYGKEGLRKIARDPSLVEQAYKVHPTQPRIYWLARAAPKLTSYLVHTERRDPVSWIFNLAVESYCLAIDVLEKDPSVEVIQIHDGNWGCGAFGGNLNTTFVLLNMAISVANTVSPHQKQLRYTYHAYDQETLKKLAPGISFWETHHQEPFEEILKKIRDFHARGLAEWSSKL